MMTAAFAARNWRLVHLRSLLHLFPRAASSRLGDPELDWDFILNPSNTETIRENCHRRQSDGDIDLVLELHRRQTQDPNEERQKQLLAAALRLPNLSHPESPVGEEKNARLLASHFPSGTAVEKAKSAAEVGTALAQLRTANVSLSTGQRTYFLLGGLALLERALVQLALRRLTEERGFEQVGVPDVIPAELVERCGFPTRGLRTQVYHVDEEEGQCLAGTAEMSLAGCVAGRTFSPEELPLRLCAVSRCYRREAPKQEEVLYRVHQFTKVEMFGVCAPGDSSRLLAEFVEMQTAFLRDLELQYRVLEMPTEELGAPAHRKLDVEVLMRHSGGFGEVCSASDCTDFQARRLLIRREPGFAATVNGTAVAVPRVIKAILEEHQNPQGHVNVPEVLWPWMHGVHVLRRQHPPMTMKFRP